MAELQARLAELEEAREEAEEAELATGEEDPDWDDGDEEYWQQPQGERSPMANAAQCMQLPLRRVLSFFGRAPRCVTRRSRVTRAPVRASLLAPQS